LEVSRFENSSRRALQVRKSLRVSVTKCEKVRREARRKFLLFNQLRFFRHLGFGSVFAAR
jgi:hypothetical protein